MSEVQRTRVAVVGAGQAGLSTSWLLTEAGVEHVVFEAETPAHAWASSRWDSFTLVTPNWQCRLPGYAYEGPDPDGFMNRAEVMAWLAGYVASFDPPVQAHTRVARLSQRAEGGYLVEVESPMGAASWEAEDVVIATGGYHLPIIPGWAAALDPEIVQLHSQDYRNPERLPAGAVLVVGSGQSGAQIAEDLHLAGRRVHLAVGDAPRVARRYRGRDVMTWLWEMGLYDTPVAQYPGGLAAREKTNHYVTGRDGGHDIDLRRFAREGMRLHGRIEDGAGSRVRFGPGPGAALDHADRVYNSICHDIDGYLEREQIATDEPSSRYVPVWEPAADEPVTLDLHAAGVGSIVWALGFRPDYRWIEVGVFTGSGRPTHHRGVTGAPGLYVLGLPWLHTWGSGRFLGVARDAEFVVADILARRTRSARAA